MGWLTAIGNIFKALGAIMGFRRDQELRKDGGRRVENVQMKEGIEAGKKADEKRKDKPDRTIDEHLDRM